MNQKFYPLPESEGVINFKQDDSFLELYISSYKPMSKITNLINRIKCQMLEVSDLSTLKNTHYESRGKLIEEGVECELLELGANKWKKGKIRIKVNIEFCPDEPELTEADSLLQDIRQKIN